MSWSLFLWMVHCKSGFPNLKRVHGTTQGEFVSGSVNSKAAYFEYRMCLPPGLLPRNKHWKFEPTMLPRRFNSGNLPALRIQISGHWFINITAERLRHTVYERGYFTYRSFKGLRKPFERIPNGILFEHYLNTLRKWTNLVFQLLNSPSVEKNTHIVDKVPTVFGFCSDNFHGSYQVWVYFINTSCRIALNMWQLRIWYL